MRGGRRGRDTDGRGGGGRALSYGALHWGGLRHAPPRGLVSVQVLCQMENVGIGQREDSLIVQRLGGCCTSVPVPSRDAPSGPQEDPSPAAKPPPPPAAPRPLVPSPLERRSLPGMAPSPPAAAAAAPAPAPRDSRVMPLLPAPPPVPRSPVDNPSHLGARRQPSGFSVFKRESSGMGVRDSVATVQRGEFSAALELGTPMRPFSEPLHTKASWHNFSRSFAAASPTRKRRSTVQFEAIPLPGCATAEVPVPLCLSDRALCVYDGEAEKVIYHWAAVDKAELLAYVARYEAAYNALADGEPDECKQVQEEDCKLAAEDKAWGMLRQQTEMLELGAQPSWDGVFHFGEK